MKLPVLFRDRRAARQTALFALAVFFCAHAFCFFNLTYSGPSVSLNAASSANQQIEGGLFLQPVYFALRGGVASPLFTGLIAALCLAAALPMIAELLGIGSAALRLALCAALCCHPSLTALFAGYIEAVSSYIAFVLLAFIGGNMVREALSKEEEEVDDSFAFRTMLTLAIATSIDALAVGVTFAFLSVKILPAVSIIGCTTFCLSLAGVAVGNYFGTRYKRRAELTGGILLVLLGTKILLEHLGVLAF